MSARRGQARHAAPGGPLPDDDRARSPLKVGDALRQRVLRRGQDVLPEPEPEPPAEPGYAQAAPSAAPARHPEPATAFRPEPAPAFRPEPAPAFRPEPATAFRPEPAPAFRPEPATAFRPEPAPAFLPEPSAAPAFRRETVPVVETRESWVRRGKAQFDYLVGHGLQPGDRMLEIGSGTLSAGHLFIQYLSTGHYYGVDISPDALLAAQRILVEFDVQAKMPHLTLVDGLDLEFLPARQFTVVHAHNLFAQSPAEMIGEGLAQVRRIMSRDAIFDFTFDRADGVEPQALRKDFYRRADTLIGLADAHGFNAELMKDWEQFGHGHSKLRLIRRW